MTKKPYTPAPYSTNGLYAEIDRLRATNAELLAALQGLFEHCSMIHKHWGDADNTKQANDAQHAARAAIAKAQP